MPLARIMKKLTLELDEKDEARERIINSSRQIIRLTRQSVALIHKGESKRAQSIIQDALKELRQLSHVRDEYPELYYGGILTPAQQEIAEASILAALSDARDFPEFDVNLISPAAYLLGMADTVGELRRLCLDRLREVKLGEAKRAFAKMEETYEALLELDYPSGLTPGLRHKVDSARRLVEETRTDVTRAQLLLRTKGK